jgi:hypothetical protein
VVVADFTDVTFNGEVDFADACFGGNVHGSKQTDSVLFTTAKFYCRTRSASFIGASFNALIDLVAIGQEKPLDILWKQIDGRIRPETERVYLFLEKNFSDLGHFEDMDSAYFARRVLQRRNSFKQGVGGWPGGVVATLLEWSCGYGVRPSRVIIFAAGIIGICGFLYVHPRAIRARNESQPTKFFSRLARGLLYSLDVFLPGIEVMSQSENWRSTGRFRYVVLVEKFIGWFMLSLFIVTFAARFLR